MSRFRIGSPLFILRDECAVNLDAVLKKLASIGFDGVELLGLFGHTPAEVRRMLDRYGLAAIGNHVPYEAFEKDARRVIEDHYIMGCGYITVSTLPEECLPDGAAYPACIASLNQWGAMAADAGMKLLFHNHAGEMAAAANNASILENLLDDTKPDRLYLEPDVGWMRIAGADPLYYLQKYANRCPVIHLKDFYRSAPDAFTFRPVGYGEMDNARLYAQSLACAPAWYVMDHDCAYERDPYDDLALSLAYFKQLAIIFGE